MDETAAAIEEANRLAGDGSMDAALQTVRDARARVEDPRLIYMEAQLLRLMGDCVTAVATYREFLETNPTNEDRAYAEESLEECGAATPEPEPAPTPAPTPAPGPAPIAETGEQTPSTGAAAPQTGRRSFPRPGSIALWAAGGVGIVAGTGMIGGAFSMRAAAVDGRLMLEDYQSKERVAGGLSAAGVAVLSVGVGLLIAGVVHHVVLRRRTSRRR